MRWRAKIKCPTCWAETYTHLVSSKEEEHTAVDELAHGGHDRPEVVRRDGEDGSVGIEPLG